MEKNLNWLKKEVEKDKRDIKEYKNDIIRDILSTPKKDIVSGPKQIKKKSLWKKILTNVKNLLKY